MTITLTIRDVSISPALRQRAEDLAEGFSRYFNNLRSVSWGFSSEAGDVAVSCRIQSRSGFYRASARAETARTALDLAVEKILKQRRRKKAALGRKRRQLD